MKCKIGDAVMVVKSSLSGFCGTVVAPGKVFGFDWIVEFDHPVECQNIFLGWRQRSRRVHFPDGWLLPICPDAEPVEVETEREVVA